MFEIFQRQYRDYRFSNLLCTLIIVQMTLKRYFEAKYWNAYNNMTLIPISSMYSYWKCMLLSPVRYKIPIWPYVFVARNIQGIRPTLLIAVTSFPHNESAVHTHSLSVWFEIIAPFYLLSAHLYAVAKPHNVPQYYIMLRHLHT